MSCSKLVTPTNYENQTGCLPLKPTDIDTLKVRPNLWYEIEGSLPTGTPILIIVKGEKLMDVMRLRYSDIYGKTVGYKFEGNVFTMNYLGNKSILTKKQIDDKKTYDPQQREILLRDRFKKKYVLRSILPIRAKFEIRKDEETGNHLIVMIEDKVVHNFSDLPAQKNDTVAVNLVKLPQKETSTESNTANKETTVEKSDSVVKKKAPDYRLFKKPN